MAALDLSVMPGREDFNELMPDSELVERFLKERRPHRLGSVHPVRELGAVVRLDAFNRVRELFHAMADKLGSRIGSVLLELASSTAAPTRHELGTYLTSIWTFWPGYCIFS